MCREPRGYFHVQVNNAHPGALYRFRLANGDERPDPASRFQPQGVHGPSQVVDPGFDWADVPWRGIELRDCIFYELHVGTFTPEGTFESAIPRLAELASLGVTAIELMPVAEFPGNHGWGYDGVNLYAPHHAYGGPQGLRMLVNACHSQGLAVFLDVVYNRLGPTGNYLHSFAPYFTDHYVTPWGEAVNLDGAGSDEVRRYFCENAAMWLRDFHFDGLRIDAVHAMVDTSAVHILEQLSGETRRLEAELGRRLLLIAESNLNDPRIIRPAEIGGYGIHAQWSDDFHHSLHAILTGEKSGYYADFGSMADLAKALRQAFVYDGQYSAFRRRQHGRPATGASGHQFLGYLQTHDQVGNRAKGERSSRLLTAGQLKLAAALTFTAPFLPMLFQGEEWAASSPFPYFTDHQDPGVARRVREGRRREFATFGWDPQEIPDPQAEATFLSARLDWSERRREPHSTLLEWHRELIRLRRSEPALRDGNLAAVEVNYDEDAKWLVMTRGAITLSCNFAAQRRSVPVRSSAQRMLLVSGDSIRLHSGAMELPAHSAAILRSGNPTK